MAEDRFILKILFIDLCQFNFSDIYKNSKKKYNKVKNLLLNDLTKFSLFRNCFNYTNIPICVTFGL